MRSMEGNEDKDNDRGRKSRCGRIKLSTHLLGRVSAALGMKTLNPTVAQKGRNSRLNMSYYLSLGPNIHLPQTLASSSPFSSLLAPSCSVFVATFFFRFMSTAAEQDTPIQPTNRKRKNKNALQVCSQRKLKATWCHVHFVFTIQTHDTLVKYGCLNTAGVNLYSIQAKGTEPRYEITPHPPPPDDGSLPRRPPTTFTTSG